MFFHSPLLAICGSQVVKSEITFVQVLNAELTHPKASHTLEFAAQCFATRGMLYDLRQCCANFLFQVRMQMPDEISHLIRHFQLVVHSVNNSSRVYSLRF